MKCFHYELLIFIPMAWGAVPGTFFWKPRLGLDLVATVTQSSQLYDKPTRELIQEGVIVLIDGYAAGLTALALVDAFTDRNAFLHLHPMSAYFFTDAYRWALRYLDNASVWLEAHGGNYCHTHKVWKRRFYYMDRFVPKWLQNVLFFVSKKEWKEEESFYKNKYVKQAEPVFSQYYGYRVK